LSAAQAAQKLTWQVTEDADAVHALRCSAIAAASPGLVRADTKDYFEEFRDGAGWLMACVDARRQMVAYCALALRMPVVSCLADELGADLAGFCVLDGTCVAPDWRGLRLHQAAINERLRLAAVLGLSVAAATVAPENIYSLRGLLKSGFEVRRFATVYGGLERLVVCRTIAAETQAWQFVRLVPLGDRSAHQSALADGLAGYACVSNEQGEFALQYGQRIASAV
jgi:hypothetical protein